MDALEWLNEEGFKDSTLLKNTEYDYPVSVIMERYANYKTRELETKVLDFRQLLKNIDTSVEDTVCIWDNNNALIKLEAFFDEHFNLTTERHGTTG